MWELHAPTNRILLPIGPFLDRASSLAYIKSNHSSTNKSNWRRNPLKFPKPVLLNETVLIGTPWPYSMTARSLPCSQKWETAHRPSRLWVSNHSDSEWEILSSQPASTRPNATAGLRRASPTDDIHPTQPVLKRPKTEAGFSNLRNKIAYIETRRAKTKKSVAVLREHASKGTCPVGLQYRPKPHLRPDKDFQTCLHQICSRAEQDLFQLTIRQQEKKVSADTKALTDLKETLASMWQKQTRTSRTEDPAGYQQIHSQRPQAQTSCQT